MCLIIIISYEHFKCLSFDFSFESIIDCIFVCFFELKGIIMYFLSHNVNDININSAFSECHCWLFPVGRKTEILRANNWNQRIIKKNTEAKNTESMHRKEVQSNCI